MTSTFMLLAAASGFVAVALGAFGAHGLQGRLGADMLAVFEVGVRYQMFHALALFGVALALERWPLPVLHAAGWAFVAGSVIFCGSLYLLSLTGIRSWGAVAPIGGTAFLAGWALLAWGAWSVRS